MNIFSIRRRIGSAVGAVIAAIGMFGCGALLAFVLSPGQALEARRIDKMPEMDAGVVASTASGKDVLVTGHLEDNPPVDEGGFVAYKLEEWVVTSADPEDPEDEPSGRWERVEQVVPDLHLDVGGESVSTLRADNVTLSGGLREELLYSDSVDGAEDGAEWVPAGSQRLRGFYNGDLVTVWGKKASAGGIIPKELYAGDRVAFAESKHQAARGLFFAGICLMGLAPVVLVGGVLSGLFGRRRR